MRTRRGDKHDQWIVDMKRSCEKEKRKKKSENENLVCLEKERRKNGSSDF
jgi:hypothetical protein